MSTQEIIAELPKLNRQDLEQVSSKLSELLAIPPASRGGGRRLKKFAGAVRGLPADMAENHDHYLHGRPKK
jgi:mRNA-degrading endonuclease RelE of RelBE toxin-antitoxin system